MLALPLAIDLEKAMSIEGTISPELASRRKWEAVVIGAGPSGAMTAHQLARRGISTLLVDRATFPRSKVCGCCLNGNALAALGQAGLDSILTQEGAVPLHTLHLQSGSSQARLKLPQGRALSRSTFDCRLIEAGIRRGVAFLPRCQAVPLPGSDHESTRKVRLKLAEQEQAVSTNIVIVADGLGSPSLRSLGQAEETRLGNSRIGLGVVIPSAEHFYEPGVIYMTCGPQGYLGLVRLEDGNLDLAAAVDPLQIRSAHGSNRIMESLLRRANWPVPQELPLAKIRGTPLLTRTTRHVSGHRFFVVGDATGYVEPFTGEGMAWGLTSAISLAEMASDAVKNWSPRMAQSWHHHHACHVRPRQRWCRLLTGMLRHQGLTSVLVKTLGLFPGLSNPVVRHLNITPFRLMERFG